MVTILNIEPGSYMSVMARFLYNSVSAGLRKSSLVKSKAGRLAMPKMAPVLGSITMIVPPLALCFSMALSSSRSTIFWIKR